MHFCSHGTLCIDKWYFSVLETVLCACVHLEQFHGKFSQLCEIEQKDKCWINLDFIGQESKIFKECVLEQFSYIFTKKWFSEKMSLGTVSQWALDMLW